jgi:exosome complex exonuclease DIS3/RRP44
MDCFTFPIIVATILTPGLQHKMICEQRREAFYRKSRRGQVMRLVRDRYLKDQDGGLGIGAGSLHGQCLSVEQVRTMVSEAPLQQLLVVDTNIALHQIDVLEHRCPAIALVVVTQTVLQELRHLNLAGYRRLADLIKDESKSFVFFANEMSVHTSSYRRPAESINDANDRAIRETATYFGDLIKDAGSVVFLSNDKENQVSSIL